MLDWLQLCTLFGLTAPDFAQAALSNVPPADGDLLPLTDHHQSPGSRDAKSDQACAASVLAVAVVLSALNRLEFA